MKKFFKQIVLVVFWSSLFFLTIFYVPEIYYPHWAVTFILFVIFIIYISFRTIPSKKEEKLFKLVLEDYKKIVKLEEEVRKESLKMEINCPACKNKNNYWSYLDDYRCNKCGSEMWSTNIKDLGKEFEKVFENREKIFSFYAKLNSRMKRKLKKIYFSGTIR